MSGVAPGLAPGPAAVVSACSLAAVALLAARARSVGRAVVAARGAPPAWSLRPGRVGPGPAWWRARRPGGSFEPGELVAVLVAMEAAVAGGCTLHQAVARAAADRPGPCGRDLADIAARVGQGAPLVEALDRWAASRPATGAGVVADALALASGSGAAHGPALRAAAGTVRDREALDREVRALAAQARASALVLVATPVAFAVVTGALDAGVRGFLIGTPGGWACLGAGMGLEVAGARWMAALIGAVR